MTWNWQRPDWPNFRWQRTRLEAAEKQFLVSGGVFVGSVRHLVKEERNQLTIEAMSTEAVTTSEMERNPCRWFPGALASRECTSRRRHLRACHPKWRDSLLGPIGLRLAGMSRCPR